MNSPPSSLASLLAYPSGQQEAQQPTTEEDGAVLMTYLQHSGYEQAAQDAAASSSNRYALNGSYGRALAPRHAEEAAVATEFKDPVAPTEPAPGSPIDASVSIPPALSSVALPPIDPQNLAPLASLPAVEPFTSPVAVTGDRGEMGGKRRKQAQDRAGWKEMAEEDEKRRQEAEASNFVGFDATAEAVASVVTAVDGTVPEGDDNDKRSKRAKLSKESRAEQNRKAQQVFRRKREEKIKTLEQDAHALSAVRNRLAVAEQRLADLAMEYEAKTIEAAALGSALTAIATGAATSVLRPDGGLVLNEAEYEARDKEAIGAADGRLAVALEGHTKASRELAKVNRARREETRSQQQPQHE